MNFKEAEQKLTEVSGGRYRHLSYTITTQSDGTKIQACGLYVDASLLVSGKSWDEAFLELGKKLHPENHIVEIDVDDVDELEF